MIVIYKSMTDSKLLEYVRQQTAMGTIKENIKKYLVASSWSQTDIDAAFSAVSSEPVKKRGVIRQISRYIFWGFGILYLLIMISGGIFGVYFFNQAKNNIDSGQASEIEKGFFTSINAALIQGSLLAFDLENKKYPTTLDELMPRYIQQIPTDPATSQPFRYSPIDAGLGYNLCSIKSGQEICATASTTIDGKSLDY